MQIAICDDEAVTRELLAEKVREFDKEAQIEFYENGEKLLLQKQEPDILFLDIQMPGRNGIEIAKELRKEWCNVILIFVTAIEEYVFDAFDVGAFHYLVKPIREEKFTEVLDKAVEQYKVIQQHVPDKEKKYLMINNGKIHCKVRIDDIIYAEVFNRKIVLHNRKEEIEYYGTMSELESAVGDTFFRPHRAYLINFKYVEKYDNANIYLETGVVLLAKQKYAEFVKKYMRYNQRR